MSAKKIFLSLITLFFIALCIAVINKREVDVAGSNSAKQNELNELGFFLFNEPRILKPVPLLTLGKKVTTLADNSNTWQMINFGYMFCPDICPINLRLMSDIKKQWVQDSQNAEFTLTHVTFDPKRDTPDRLAPYLEFIDTSYQGLTGSIENIRKVAQQLNTVFIHEKPDEYGNYFITHSDSIALLNPSGEYIGLFKGPYNEASMLKVLKILIN